MSGSISQTVDAASTDRNFQGFSVLFGSAGMRVDGRHIIARCTPMNEFTAVNLDYQLSFDGGTLVVESANTFRRIEAVRGVMGGSFRMNPPAATGNVFDVSSSRDFAFDYGDNLSAEEFERVLTEILIPNTS